MTTFDFNDALQVDLEKIEAIELDRSGEFPIVYAIGMSGNRYMVGLGREQDFFEKIKLIERSSEKTQHYVSL